MFIVPIPNLITLIVFIMKKSVILFVAATLLTTCMLTSCLYGIKGSGKVVRNERQVASFSSVSASAGLEVILAQDSVVKVVVEADSNLQEIIKTEVTNGELKIYPKQRISSCKSKKIYVTLKSIHALVASSGADISSKMELKLAALQVSVSSGAHIDLQIAANSLNVDGSSGGDILLAGTTETLDIDGSSGANINASGLSSKSCNAGASSGAALKVTVTEKLNAHASSGGNINVAGNPKERNVQESSGGEVSVK